MIDASWYVRPDAARERTSAGGVVVRRRGGRVEVALAREAEHPTYVLPKGGVEPGESLEAAAAREVEEEAGLTGLVLLGELGTRSRLTFDRRAWVTVHYFVFTTGSEAAAPTDAAKHFHAARWFPLDDLPPMLWPEQRELLETHREQIEKMLG